MPRSSKGSEKASRRTRTASARDSEVASVSAEPNVRAIARRAAKTLAELLRAYADEHEPEHVGRIVGAGFVVEVRQLEETNSPEAAAEHVTHEIRLAVDPASPEDLTVKITAPDDGKLVAEYTVP